MPGMQAIVQSQYRRPVFTQLREYLLRNPNNFGKQWRTVPARLWVR